MAVLRCAIALLRSAIAVFFATTAAFFSAIAVFLSAIAAFFAATAAFLALMAASRSAFIRLYEFWALCRYSLYWAADKPPIRYLLYHDRSSAWAVVVASPVIAMVRIMKRFMASS